MSNEGFFNAAAPARGSFEAIEAAVRESSRGRWFLDEFARRQRSRETATLLAAMARLESALAANPNLIAERLGKVLELTTPDRCAASLAASDPASKHMKFFKQDEELFERPAPSATPPIVAVKEESAKGATLVIRQKSEMETQGEAEAPPLQPEHSDKEAPSKNRIVIIRHKAGEPLAVPLHDELRASA